MLECTIKHQPGKRICVLPLTVKVKTILGRGPCCMSWDPGRAFSDHATVPGCWTPDRWGLLGPGAWRRNYNDPSWLEAFSSFPARQEEGDSCSVATTHPTDLPLKAGLDPLTKNPSPRPDQQLQTLMFKGLVPTCGIV